MSEARSTRPYPLRIPENLMELAEAKSLSERTDRSTALRQLMYAGAEDYVVGLLEQGRVSSGKAAELLDTTVHRVHELARERGVEIGGSVEDYRRSRESISSLLKQVTSWKPRVGREQELRSARLAPPKLLPSVYSSSILGRPSGPPPTLACEVLCQLLGSDLSPTSTGQQREQSARVQNHPLPGLSGILICMKIIVNRFVVANALADLQGRNGVEGASIFCAGASVHSLHITSTQKPQEVCKRRVRIYVPVQLKSYAEELRAALSQAKDSPAELRLESGLSEEPVEVLAFGASRSGGANAWAASGLRLVVDTSARRRRTPTRSCPHCLSNARHRQGARPGARRRAVRLP